MYTYNYSQKRSNAIAKTREQAERVLGQFAGGLLSVGEWQATYAFSVNWDEADGPETVHARIEFAQDGTWLVWQCDECGDDVFVRIKSVLREEHHALLADGIAKHRANCPARKFNSPNVLRREIIAATRELDDETAAIVKALVFLAEWRATR